MTKRKDDPSADPPGGRAAERLKQFEQARTTIPETTDEKADETTADANEAGKDDDNARQE
jgi:hypothetical protein